MPKTNVVINSNDNKKYRVKSSTIGGSIGDNNVGRDKNEYQSWPY